MTIRLARGQADHDALYAFRYEIYTKEMNRVQKHADHIRQRIEDPLDETAHNFIALSQGRIVGCVRVNFAIDGGLDYYRDLLNMMALVTEYPANASLCTRLMVTGNLRGGTLALRLCRTAFRFILSQRIRWNFIDCNDHLVSFFEKLGYIRRGQVNHEEYGRVNAMSLDMHDWRHLIACRSPFASPSVGHNLLGQRIDFFDSQSGTVGMSLAAALPAPGRAADVDDDICR